MGAWADHSVDRERLLGLESSDFLNHDAGVFNEEMYVVEVESSARDMLRDMLVEKLHELVLKLGENTMFDQIAESSVLRQRLDSMLALAYMHRFYRGHYILDGDAKIERSEYYYERLMAGIRPFADMVRATLTDPDDPPTYRTGSSYVRTTTDWWD